MTSSKLNYLPKTSPANAFPTKEVRASTYEWGGGQTQTFSPRHSLSKVLRPSFHSASTNGILAFAEKPSLLPTGPVSHCILKSSHLCLSLENPNLHLSFFKNKRPSVFFICGCGLPSKHSGCLQPRKNREGGEKRKAPLLLPPAHSAPHAAGTVFCG